jgi:hypothetical protein
MAAYLPTYWSTGSSDFVFCTFVSDFFSTLSTLDSSFFSAQKSFISVLALGIAITTR